MAVLVGGAALALGVAICFQGGRLLQYILPVAAFLIGGAVGGEAVSLIFGTPILSSAPSMVVGGVVGLIFAALAHAHYHWTMIGAVALVGYIVGSVWLTVTGHAAVAVPGGFGLAMVFALLALVVPRVTVALATAAPGALLVLGGALVLVGSVTVNRAGLTTALRTPLPWLIGWVAITTLGVLVQLLTVPRKATTG